MQYLFCHLHLGYPICLTDSCLSFWFQKWSRLRDCLHFQQKRALSKDHILQDQALTRPEAFSLVEPWPLHYLSWVDQGLEACWLSYSTRIDAFEVLRAGYFCGRFGGNQVRGLVLETNFCASVRLSEYIVPFESHHRDSVLAMWLRF